MQCLVLQKLIRFIWISNNRGICHRLKYIFKVKIHYSAADLPKNQKFTNAISLVFNLFRLVFSITQSWAVSASTSKTPLSYVLNYSQ